MKKYLVCVRYYKFVYW